MKTHGDAYDRMHDKITAALKADGQKKLYVFYSAYDSHENDEDDTPIDNLDKIAARGKVVLVADRDEFWGGRKSKDYRSAVLTDPTWLQVAVCANAMIRTTRDLHHQFLEGIQFRHKEGDVKVYELCMGS